MERIETMIVGGGQAGLATSYYLTQQGREHLVLERAELAGSSWRNGRWDSFTLVTPNWTMRMPGAEYDGPDREGYMPRDAIVRYFEEYTERFNLPVKYNTEVLAVEPVGGVGGERRGYVVRTNEGIHHADNVVMATGFEQLPKIPSFAGAISPEVKQTHSSAYRNPQSLPEGAVLVVGSAQSGAQIAEELNLSGRKVYLSTGSTGRAPRRYRGKDVFEWLYISGFFDIPAAKMPFPIEHFSPPHLSGTKGGHTLNLHQFARDGITLLGHLRGAAGNSVSFAPDLRENLARADGFERQVLNMVDGYIQRSGLDVPAEDVPQLRDGHQQPLIEELDLKAAGVSTIIWATGYSFDFGVVKMPVCDEHGVPIQTRGVANYPGLYFVGLPWSPALKPATLAGVSGSAEHIVLSIAESYAHR
ncbi:MAG: FAD-dependent oxidoreductase [Chloroflexota bacterium]